MIEKIKGFPKNRTKIGACRLKKEKNIGRWEKGCKSSVKRGVR
jgi:hypothetical protein